MKARWMGQTIVLFAILMVLSGTAFAFQTAAPAAAPAAAAAGSLWSGILKGILAGALAAGLGWAAQQKNEDGTHEPFDIVQFVVTVILGALVGAYAGWKNLSLMDVENLPILSSVIAGIELLMKVIWRNGSVKLAGALATLKAGTAANPTPAPAPSPEPPKA